jgi:hypothetical protein
VAAYAARFLSIYPAPKADITVHAVDNSFSGGVDASGNGFDNLIQEMVNLRQKDHAAGNVYYLAAITPTSDFGSYCGNGCVTGLSPVASDGDSSNYVATSIGMFPNDSSGDDAATETAVHEVGHAHGLEHSPCGGAASPDPQYPYSNASIGVWGYDLSTKQLMNPSTATDMMGYCDTTFVSDYVYNELFNRMKSDNNAAMVYGTEVERPYRFLNVRKDGSVDWGRETPLSTPPRGEAHTVTFLGANGAALGTATAAFYRYDHLAGGYLLVPNDAPAGTVKVSISGPHVTTMIAR